jgi:diguanylate cyclase (GGDEF)-like protein
MFSIPSVLSATLAVVSLFTLSLGVYALARLRGARGAGSFVLLMAAITCYCLGSAFELAAESLERMWAAVRMEYLGLAPLPAFWFLFSIQYTTRRLRIPRWVTAVLLAVSALAFAAVLTNDSHHLFFTTIGLDDRSPFPAFGFTQGPLYDAWFGYLVAALLAGLVLFFRMCLLAAPGRRALAVVMLVGTFIPGAFAVAYQFGLAPWGLDLPALAIAATGVLWALGLFRYRLFDIVPVAMNAVFRAMRDGVVILDVDGRVAEFNPRAGIILQGAEPLRLRVRLREHLAGRPDLLERIECGQESPHDVMIPVADEPRYYDLRVSPVRNTAERVVGRTLVLVDTTERVRLHEELRRQAVTDELTGVCNRRHLAELSRIEMDRARRSGRPVSAVAIDLDHFKRVNDTHGHAAGDAVLKAASALWKTALRTTDVLGRSGGEEFVILLPDTDQAAAVLVAERLRASTEALRVRVNETELAVTASFGVAASRAADAGDPAALIRRADEALYAAKEGGRNRVAAARGEE